MSKTTSNNLDGNVYRDFPELYDLIYHRYFKGIEKLQSFLKASVASNPKILEIAAGTGEVSVPLLELGYDVTSLDLNSGMLKQLKKKAADRGLKAKTVVCDMNELDIASEYDVIVMRQSVNYFMGTTRLKAGLRKVHRALKNGGKYVFNAPNFQEGTTEYPIVENRYSKDGAECFVLESNILDGRILNHRQDSVVWNGHEVQYIKDENAFYMFTVREFEDALKKAGFSSVKLSHEGKTIYGVAEK